MIGALVIVFVIVFVLPPLFLIAGGLVSAVLGWAGTTDAAERHEGSELVDLYK